MLYFVLIMCIVIFLIYLLDVRKVKFNIRLIVLISIFASISYILNMIKFIRMPQGGSITLFSMLPVMLLSFIYGKGIGCTLGILVGILKMFDGIVFLNPLQFFLDYIFSNMILGFACIFGMKKKFTMFLGCILSGFFSVMFNVFSGVLFFRDFLPEGVNIWLYSFIYNFSTLGVEILLTSVFILFVPVERIKKALKIKKA